MIMEKLQRMFSDYEVLSTGGGFCMGVKEVKGVLVAIHENGATVYFDHDNLSYKPNGKLMDREAWERENNEGDSTNYIDVINVQYSNIDSVEALELLYKYFSKDDIKQIREDGTRFSKAYWS